VALNILCLLAFLSRSSPSFLPYFMCDTGPVPPSPCVRPLLSALHLWRVTPTQESLRKIIRPSKEQLPIVLRATRMAGRKVVLSVWAVSDGEAMTVSVYDHK
ncbi:unnamed protein product, partial [Ectocarpus sp. 13 AM-2016]